ncbi:MAG: TraR/DksA family transcriptional regulator [Bdellovibrionaceae bacterium]|nr:TraR/DksA family transcriptional regulator [Pseudobdellovibrionaceae bacterium]
MKSVTSAEKTSAVKTSIAKVSKGTKKLVAKSDAPRNEKIESKSTSEIMAMEELSLEALVPKLKEALIFQKSSILNKSNEFKKLQSENLQISDEAEMASNDLSQNLSIHLQERNLSSLIQIEKALSKMANGTYGECESCGDHIQPKRLQARPLATLCIACMEDLEEDQ